MWVWAMVVVAVMAVGAIAIITDARNESKRIDVKKLNKEIELEKLRLESYEKETEKMRLELEHSKQLLLEHKQK
ncbi:hypothetical protein DCE79_06060 [Lysinibacillus sp. 2017]|uniref:hypothetical protein n=1 Tax=unclassified Lysinibacillus TaxID=2636778 RepID=UPI000D5270AD|nr:MULTISPECIES: hypothetical protein [unclassified Lysinibacillus]AWE06990.1 hypothetical protein DCE79_06060 [Lysinibacillus sp. 2017]TGN37086.1 hypothetical protein E4L99_00950 [Lysinibacillus sp. S2017]